MLLVWIALAFADTCAAWGEPEGQVDVNLFLSESSGVAASRTRAGVLYTHEDRNRPDVLHAFTLDGRSLGEHQVKGPGVSNVDWEDLASAPCPDDVGDCLYIGDIGDNDGVRDHITVYIAREPEAPGDPAKVIRTLEAAYPDGPEDAEALLVHPCTGDTYVVTKRSATVYRFPEDAHRGVATLAPVASFTLDGSDVTAGDFDADGDRAVLRTEDALWEWTNVDPDSPEVHWGSTPTAIDLPLAHTEAVAYTADGDLISTAEGTPMPLVRVPCLEPLPPEGTCDFEGEPLCGCATTTHSPLASSLVVVFLMLYSRRRVDA